MTTTPLIITAGILIAFLGLGVVVIYYSGPLLETIKTEKPVSEIENKTSIAVTLEINHYNSLTGESLQEDIDVNATAVWFDGEHYSFTEIDNKTFNYEMSSYQNNTVYIMLSAVPNTKQYILNFWDTKGDQLNLESRYTDIDNNGIKEIVILLKPLGYDLEINPKMNFNCPWLQTTTTFG